MDITWSNMQMTCRCNERQPDALWGFCRDDWYCPQCGDPLCRFVDPAEAADSAADVADEAEFWLYPSGGNETNPRFQVKLFLLQPQRDRSCVRISPTIATAELFPAGDFKVAIFPPRSPQATTVEITPREGALEGIRNTGKRCQLRVTGDFPATMLRLRLCRTPHVYWEVMGRGVRPREEEASGWLIQRAERLELDVRLIAERAPLKLARSAGAKAFTPMSGMLTRVPEVTTSYAPAGGAEISAETPGKWQLQVNAEIFDAEGERLTLAPDLEFVGWDGELPMIDLDYVPSTIRITPPELNVSTMYWGEVRSNDWNDRETNPDDPQLSPVIGEVSIENCGEQPRQLRRPTLDLTTGTPSDRWFHVDWHPSVPVDERGVARVEPYSHALLLVRIDLQSAPLAQQREKLDPGPRVRLRIEADDGTDFWNVNVAVTCIEPRRPLPYPLAIDFGNSYSFAAVLNEDAMNLPDEPVLAVHDRFHPDGFPTALLIQRYRRDNPLLSDYVIGDAALVDLSKAHADSSWPLTDLKRWLSDVRDDESRSVTVGGQALQTVRVSVLAQMYLYGLIRRAEAVLRRFYITQIVTSYPAKLDPLARRRFVGLVNELCQQVTTIRRDLGQPLSHVADRIDEANAVATGFVLDFVQRGEYFTEELERRSSFIVASCDFGGGSFDTALLRFRVLDPDAAIPEYSSEYLGIGGLTDFGGDNVTVAVFEMLRGRAEKRLKSSNLPPNLLENVPSPGKQHSRAGLPRWLFEVLWAAADGWKQYLCEPDAHADQTVDLPLCTAAPEFVTFRELLLTMLAERTGLPTLDEVHQHRLSADLRGAVDYSIAQRFTDVLAELAAFEQRSGAPIDFIVLGGGGSRIGLLRELIEQTFPHAQMVYDRQRLKRRVADGLVLTVNYLESDQHQLALSGNYTTRSLGVFPKGIKRAIELIPACTAVNVHAEFPIADKGRPVSLQQLQSQDGNPLLYANVAARMPVRLGIFAIAGLAITWDKETVATLGFAEPDAVAEQTEEDRLELRIRRQDQVWVVPLTPLR